MSQSRRVLGTAALLFVSVASASAQEEVPTVNSGDTAWLLTSSALVLMMTLPGLALFYGGLVRQRNVLGTMMQSFAMAGVATLVWVGWGYSIAFGGGDDAGMFYGGFDKLFLKGVDVGAVSGSIPETTFCFFQMMFAIITPALITGAYAERMKFSAMVLFSVLWVTFVYAPLAHMVWGGGWLANSEQGLAEGLDFAGGAVVHISSGVSALVCAMMLGRRKGWPKAPIPPHSVVLSFIGGSLLWVGWFGFNAGSQLAADGRASMAFLVTHVASAAGAVAWTLSEKLHRGKPGVLGAVTGAVAGLVGITPASGFVEPLPALLIGAACGVACYIFVAVLKSRIAIDDSLDAFGVHGVGGIIGAILTGVFATRAVTGADEAVGGIDGNWGQVWDQLLTVVATIGLAAVGTFILLSIVRVVCGGLRISEEEENQGLDLSQHGEEGYNFER